MFLLYHSRIIDRIIDNSIYDNKIIGIYSSYEKAEQTIGRYTKIMGFSDYPTDFRIESFELQNRIHYSHRFCDHVIYLFTAIELVGDEEIIEYYNVYTTKVNAIAKKICEKLHRLLDRKLRRIPEKYYIDCYPINADNWSEGFVTTF